MISKFHAQCRNFWKMSTESSSYFVNEKQFDIIFDRANNQITIYISNTQGSTATTQVHMRAHPSWSQEHLDITQLRQ